MFKFSEKKKGTSILLGNRDMKNTTIDTWYICNSQSCKVHTILMVPPDRIQDMSMPHQIDLISRD